MISRFEHACGCVMTRNARTHEFEHTEVCNEHGQPLSFGRAQGEGSRPAQDPYASVAQLSREQSNVAARVIGKAPELAAGYTACNGERTFTLSAAEVSELSFLAQAAQLGALTERRGHVMRKPRDVHTQAAIDRIDERLPVLNSLVAKLARRQ